MSNSDKVITTTTLASSKEMKRLPVLIAALLAILTGTVTGYFQLAGVWMPILMVVGAGVLIMALDPWKGAIILLIAVQFNVFRFNVGQFTIRPEQVVVLACLFGSVIAFLRGRFRIYSTIMALPIIGLILIGFISSALYSIDKAHSYQSIYLQIIYVSMYFFMTNALLNNRTRIDAMIKIFMVIAFFQMLYSEVALGSFFAGVGIGGISSSHFSTISYPSTSGFFQEADPLGAYAALMVLLFMAHLVARRDTGIATRRFLYAGLIVAGLTTITSMARAAWVGLLISAVVLVFYAKPKRNLVNPKTLAMFTAASLFLLVVAFPAINYVFSQTSKTDNALFARIGEIVNFSTGSGAGRVEAQAIALDRWKQNPILGYGVLSLRIEGGTDVATGDIKGSWLYSTIIQSLHDTGLIGALFMIWIHLVPVLYGLLAAKKTKDIMRKASLVGLSLGAVVLAVSSQASSLFWLGFPWVFLAILVALAKITLEELKMQEAETCEATTVGT